MNESLSRRGFLRLGAITAAGAAAAPLLAACGGGGAAAPPAKAQGLTIKLPAYLPPSAALKPDLPGTPAGVPDAYFSYPKELFKSVAKPPMSGGTAKIALKTFLSPPPPRERNAAWQEIEKRLGGTLDIQIVPSDDWPTKFNTMVAGGTLPDLFPYIETQGTSNLPAFVASQCADLTALLGGDAVKAYPNLAAIPEAFWREGVVAGKLYGIPVPRNMAGGLGFYRHDQFAAAGVSDLAQITDLDRFFELLKELTRPQERRWGIVTATGGMFGLSIISQLFGSTNLWRLEGGKFLADIETEEYKAAVEYTRKLREAGIIYPGSEGFDTLKRKNEFNAGHAAITYDGMPAFLGPGNFLQTQKKIDPKADPRPLLPIGTKTKVSLNNVVFGINLIKKADEAKVKEMLGVADFFAAPFGSEEYTLINYGVETTDHTRDDQGNPVLTEQGAKDITAPWKYAAAPTQAVYDATSRDGVKLMHEAFTKLIPLGVADPTTALYSPTEGARFEALHTMKVDRITSIIAGRSPVSDLDQLAKDWRAQGGDKMRAEFEEASQKTGD
ncbi:extracellular solute-binding protein [Nonomuraea sp. NN258]|uniref:extracellular solute-binding protein n=1 Tax=Nonomuraea antri TaxID=2730852 RepID=UPI00156970F1|nr:extracellular solute-binding protein [Nonomuraea antri]NRQ35585.1 extracellular solute-binding protein [Nonomuraea antri]